MSKTELRVPRINANDLRVEIVRWCIEDGARVEAGQDLIELETSKAVLRHPSEAAGWVRHLKRVGEIVQAGEAFAAVYPDQRSLPSEAVSSTPVPSAEQAGSGRLSSRAREWARDHGIDPSSLKRDGLVTLGDLKREAGASEPLSLAKTLEIEALCRGESGQLNSTLTVTLSGEKLLGSVRSQVPSAGILPAVLRELGHVLAANHRFLCWFEDGRVFQHERIEIGVALNSTGTAVTKVVTLLDPQLLGLGLIQERLSELAMKELRGELTLHDLRPSAFTVTDLSELGILHFVPLLNGRQCAILGIGGDSELPGRPVTLTLRFDHRVVSGFEAAKFLGELKRRLLNGV